MTQIDLDEIKALAPPEDVMAVLHFIEQRLGAEVPPGAPMASVVAYGLLIANIALNSATVVGGGGIERRTNAFKIADIVNAIARDVIAQYPTDLGRPAEVAAQRNLN